MRLRLSQPSWGLGFGNKYSQRKQLMLNKHVFDFYDFSNECFRQLLVNFDFNIFQGVPPENPGKKIKNLKRESKFLLKNLLVLSKIECLQNTRG